MQTMIPSKDCICMQTRDTKVHNFPDSRSNVPLRRRHTANNHLEKMLIMPSAVRLQTLIIGLAGILPVSFPDCQKMHCQKDTDSSRIFSKTFWITNTFHVAMLQRYKGFWDSDADHE